MRKESERTKRRIVDGLVDYGFSTTVVVSDQGNELAQRMACLATVFRDCAAKNAARLVIERDDSVLVHDRRLLVSESQRVKSVPFDYVWLARNDDPLLWVSDAAAWCYAQGGVWRSRVGPLICEEVTATKL